MLKNENVLKWYRCSLPSVLGLVSLLFGVTSILIFMTLPETNIKHGIEAALGSGLLSASVLDALVQYNTVFIKNKVQKPMSKVRDSAIIEELKLHFPLVTDPNELSSEPTLLLEPTKGCRFPQGIVGMKIRRNAFSRREMWRRYAMSLGINNLVFFLGSTPSDESADISKEIKEEFRVHDDLIMGGFPDTYQHVRAKEWFKLWYFARKCTGAYMWSLDDDIIPMWHLMEENEGVTCFSHLFLNSYPQREKGKWIISKEDYPMDRYPPYCNGSGFGISRIAAEDMVNEASKRKHNWESGKSGDVWTSGIFRVLAGVQLFHSPAVAWVSHSETGHKFSIDTVLERLIEAPDKVDDDDDTKDDRFVRDLKRHDMAHLTHVTDGQLSRIHMLSSQKIDYVKKIFTVQSPRLLK